MKGIKYLGLICSVSNLILLFLLSGFASGQMVVAKEGKIKPTFKNHRSIQLHGA